jgi:hypothetical protein
MKHYRILLEMDNGSTCRKVYVKRANIIEAMDVSKKIRSNRLVSIIPISYDEYMKGVSLKYSNTK